MERGQGVFSADPGRVVGVLFVNSQCGVEPRMRGDQVVSLYDGRQ